MVDWKSVGSTATLEKLGVVETSISTDAFENASGQVVSFGGTVTGVTVPNRRAANTSLILTLRDEENSDGGFRSALDEPNYFAAANKWFGRVLPEEDTERELVARYDRATSTMVVKDERFRIDLLQEPRAIVRSAEVRVSAPGLDFRVGPDSPVSVIHYTLDYDATDTDAVIHRWRFLFLEDGFEAESDHVRVGIWAPRQEALAQIRSLAGESPEETRARIAIDSLVGMGLSFGCLSGAAQRQIS